MSALADRVNRNRPRLVAIAWAGAAGIGALIGFGHATYALVVVALAVGIAVVFRPRWGLLAALAVAPLEQVGAVVPGFAALTWVKVLLFVTFAGFIGQLARDRTRIAVPKGVFLLYLLFFSTTVGAALFTPTTAQALGVLALAGQIMLILLMGNLTSDRREYCQLLAAIIVSSVPVTLIGLAETALHRSLVGTVSTQFLASASAGAVRITSTFYDPNALGRFLAFALVITLVAARLPEFRRFRIPLAALILVQTYCLLNTFSRGTFIAVLGIVVLFAAWERGIRSRMFASLVIVCAVGIAAVLFAPSLDILGSRLLGDAGIQGLSDRTRIYGAAIAAFWRSPLVGLGPDGMLAAIGASVGYPLSPHNLFLEVLVGYGAVGFCAIFAFAWLQVRGCLALRQGANRAYASAAVLAFAAVVLTGLSLHGFRENELWVSLGLLWACQRAFIPDVPSAARRLGHRE